MPDTKVSALTDGTTANSTDRLPAARTSDGGATWSNVYVTPGYVGTTLLGSGTALTGATVTTSQPVLNLSQTWNGTNSTLFYGAKINVSTTPNTTSSYSAPLFAVQINSNNAMVVGATSGSNGGYAFLDLRVTSSAPDYSNNTLSDNGTTLGIGAGRSNINCNGASLFTISASAVRLSQSSSFGWSSSPTDTAANLLLTRANTATLQLGAADAAAPVAQTFKVQSVVSGTSNTAGANFTIQGSQGTGTGAGGSIVFQVAPAGSSGTAQNAYSTALTIASDKTVSVAAFGIAGPSASIGLNSGSSVRAVSTSFSSWFSFSAANIMLPSGAYVGWSSGANPETGTDTYIYRDAANTLALRNGTNAQTFRVYGTTSSGNSSFLSFYADPTGYSVINNDTTGSGTFGEMFIVANALRFQTGTSYSGRVARWKISDTGHFLAETDNDYDIGAATTTRPRNLFIAGYEQMTEMTAPAAPAANSVRIYAEDNGSGKTRLMALFATGAAQQIAIEP